ncbi:helix-hairpin-helix domain-containing protein [Lacinutrix sp. Hel_I_90]|uniref:ComEA family DNA-binding protein n=1 Tax=Lacinutrix sp. Hel_I_90 TaxID=1249999 RepID=UPI0005C9CF34|nr:helix-hairpin-helix domain-containing protein [Lacinutrix sp. Hel_I_90]
MKLKSHFKFSPKQRNGIFLLLVLIVTLQCIYVFVDFTSNELRIDSNELKQFQAEIDTLKTLEIEKRKPKRYPFNPNFITDYKGYTLGMSNAEIDRLLLFREQEQWINSAKQFQQVTHVSDSLLAVISPYFKFPEWITNPKPKQNYESKLFTKTPQSEADKLDLNKATAQQLQKVYGVGEKLSERILEYRTKNKGFIAIIELEEVYGLSPETIEEINKAFNVKTPRAIKKIKLNTATRDQLVTIQYIDYEIAHNIIEQRILREGFNSFEELTKVKDFPIKKIEIIKLYLALN